MTTTETQIKAYELRKGNKLIHKGAVITVDEILNDTISIGSYATMAQYNYLGELVNPRQTMHPDNYDYNIVMVRNEIPYSELHPIALTPEILEKAGFKKQISGYRKLNNITLMYHSDGDCWLLKDYPFFDFKHLHQLQNLYHSIKGQELEINL